MVSEKTSHKQTQPVGRHRLGAADRRYCRNLDPVAGRLAAADQVRQGRARSRLRTLSRIAAASGLISATVVVVVSGWYTMAGASAIAQMTTP